jgi:hypothetical protein
LGSVPGLLWILLIGYLAILFSAALWAVAARTHSAIAKRRSQPARVPVPIDLDVAAAEPMTARELDMEREAAQAAAYA